MDATWLRCAFEARFAPSEYSDIVVVVGGQELHLHRIVLSRCVKMRELLQTNMPRVHLVDLDSDSLTVVLGHIYDVPPPTDLTPAAVGKLHAAAKVFGLSALRKLCADRASTPTAALTMLSDESLDDDLLMQAARVASFVGTDLKPATIAALPKRSLDALFAQPFWFKSRDALTAWLAALDRPSVTHRLVCGSPGLAHTFCVELELDEISPEFTVWGRTWAVSLEHDIEYAEQKKFSAYLELTDDRGSVDVTATFHGKFDTETFTNQTFSGGTRNWGWTDRFTYEDPQKIRFVIVIAACEKI